MATKGLGRGLNALFNDSDEIKEVTKNKRDIIENVVTLKIDSIEPMQNQPRKIFNQVKLLELADSIKENGIIQPILVVKKEDGPGYVIVAGERRYRAAKMVGLKEIPAIVKKYSEKKKKQIALIENIQREDLNIMEIAEALKELMDLEGYKIVEVAKATGKSSSGVSNIIRLLNLPEKIRKYVLEGKLVEGQARALLSIGEEQEQLKMAERIINNHLTVREVEKIIYSNSNKSSQKKAQKKNIVEKEIEDKLTKYFGYKVKIDSLKKNKKIIIECVNDDGLESIMERLKIKI